ncbi:MAG: transposase [Elusimicrobiota bacterium]|nr:transposase [Elusimicrobiota bacterium]
MGRRPRIHYPGAIYHVLARGVNGTRIFLDDQDYRKFLEALNRIAKDAGMVIYAYCLMPNHFHLAVKVGTVPLGAIMHRILTGHAHTFNQRYDREGHLFQGRHRAYLCLDDRYFLRLIRYIQMNPVRAELVSRPEDWPWSSRTPVELPDMETDSFDPWPKEIIAPNLARSDNQRQETLDEIGREICGTTGVGLDELRSRSKRRSFVGARILFAKKGVARGHRLGAIAAWLGSKTESVSYYLRRI